MRSVKVVIALSPRPLLRVVEHLMIAQGRLRIVSQASRRQHLLAHSCRLEPDLIVVNARLLGRRAFDTIMEIRQISPESKLILIRPVREFSHAVGNCGADCGLDEEALVTGLPSLVRKVLRKSRDL